MDSFAARLDAREGKMAELVAQFTAMKSIGGDDGDGDGEVASKNLNGVPMTVLTRSE